MAQKELLSPYVISAAYAPLMSKLIAERVEFERNMLSLTSLTTHSVEAVTKAFKKWQMTTPWGWQGAYGYALEHFQRRGTLPFEVVA